MNGVIIYNGVVVAANSNVISDVPPYAIVVGNPARIIEYRFEKGIIDKQIEIIEDFNKFIDELISVNFEMCNIFICMDHAEKEKGIFKSVDYYICNRSNGTIRHSCYASYNNVKIISGVDIPIFLEVSKKQELAVEKFNN